MAHTPGPWGIERTEKTNWIGPLRSDGKPDPVVVYIDRAGFRPDVTARRESDAHLIAAAPELLSCCKELRDALAAAMRHMDAAGMDVAAWVADVKSIGIADGIGVRAQRAIAKAEGR